MRITGRVGVLVALPLVLVLAACGAGGPPRQEGLTAEQCDRFVPLTEDYLFVYLKDDWQFAADSPGSALSAVQRVAGDVGDAADELATPTTTAAVQRVRDAYSDVVRLVDTYLDAPLVVGAPDAVADQHAALDEVTDALADCGPIDAP